jgi:hypothetical protein
LISLFGLIAVFLRMVALNYFERPIWPGAATMGLFACFMFFEPPYVAESALTW